MISRVFLSCAALVSTVAAIPRATPHPVRVEAREAQITPSPVLAEASRTFKNRRGLLSSALSDVTGDVASVLKSLGNVPAEVASGVPNFFEDFPTGDAVVSSLGLQSSELAALPTQALNVDPYANWTDAGWNVRIHGNIYKQPNTSTDDLNDLANKFLIGTNITSLPDSQQDQARNLTAEIFVVQQGNVAVAPISFEPAQSAGGSGNSSGGGGSTATGGSQTITLPYNTTDEGDFDVFMPIASNGLTDGNATDTIQKLNTYITGTTLGNSTAYLVPPTGITIVSDIDDILRITKIYQPKEGLLNSFARPFTPWENMPSIYANWSNSVPGLHFHYLTTTPEQITRNYMQYIYATYPGGSFDTRPLNFTNAAETLSVRKFLLQKILESFPQRKFILVGDVSNSDIMTDYPEMYNDNPDQIQCILLRNTTATDDDDFPYDTSGFKTIPQKNYMFFVNSDDLTNIDIANGGCYNQSVAQNLTFGYQGLLLGDDNGVINGSANNKTSAADALAANGMGTRLMLASGLVLAGLAGFL